MGLIIDVVLDLEEMRLNWKFGLLGGKTWYGLHEDTNCIRSLMIFGR